MYRRQSSVSGFTLVETLVYIAALVLLLVAVFGLVISLLRAYGAFARSRDLNVSAAVALERMGRDIRAAQSINLAASTLDAHPGRLTLTEGATTTEFYLSSGTLHVRESGVEGGALTRPGVSVDTLIFRRLDSGTSFGVR